MIESDLATYLEPIISPVTVTVGKVLPTATESVNIFSIGTLPSTLYNMQLDSLQISIRTEELWRTREICNLILTNIIGFYGQLGDQIITLWINSVTGDIYEEDGRTVHKAILLNIKH